MTAPAEFDRLFRDAADIQPGHRPLDVDLIVARGRKIHRRRRFGRVAACAGVVVVMVVGGAATVSHLSSSQSPDGVAVAAANTKVGGWWGMMSSQPGTYAFVLNEVSGKPDSRPYADRLVVTFTFSPDGAWTASDSCTTVSSNATDDNAPDIGRLEVLGCSSPEAKAAFSDLLAYQPGVAPVVLPPVAHVGLGMIIALVPSPTNLQAPAVGILGRTA